MHIALINQWYPPESGSGGVAMHNYYLANACARLGHRVTVIAQRPSSATPACQVRDGVTIIRVFSPHWMPYRRVPLLGPHYRFAQALEYSRRVCQALRALHRECPVDIAEFADVNAEGFFWRPGEMGRRFAVRCQTPAFVLARYYGRDEQPFDSTLLGWAEKRVIRRADILLAPTHDMAETIGAACNISLERFHIIPDALDTDLFSPQPESRDPRYVTILFVGRLERAKGLEVLAQAIPAVCRAAPNARFVLLGSDRTRAEGGTMRQYLEATLAEWIGAGRVELRGHVSQEKLIAAYQRADMCVVPSVLYESFSYTCAQAMACELPVVASRIGGIPETVGACGVLVESGSSERLGEAIIELCCDRTRREALGRAGRERAATRLGPSVVAARNLAVFAELSNTIPLRA